MQAFAYYLSGSKVVAEITQIMWKASPLLPLHLAFRSANLSPIIKTIDWTYIFYALNYQLAAILLAASPRWYLYQALGSNFLWILPWAIVVTKISIPESTAWTYYAIIFGGALVFDFFDVGITVLIWAIRLMKGKVRVGVVRKSF
jgi:hypothetical protein